MWTAAAPAWRLTGTRDAMTVTSVTGWRNTRFKLALDLDLTELDVLTNHPAEDSSTFTQELRARSNADGPWRWLTGVSLLHENVEQRLDIRFTPLGIRDVPRGEVSASALGVFAQGSFDLSPRWRIGAGLRYSLKHKRVRFSETVNGATVAQFKESESWDALTPRVSIEYRPVQGLLAYATVRRGFKSGGFNINQAQRESFAPEFLLAYEAGVKSTFAGGRVRLELAGFFYDYDDIQVNVLAPDAPLGAFPQVDNAASASIKGVDFGLQAQPTRRFTLAGRVQLLDARIEEFVTLNPNDPMGDPDQSGNRMANAPVLTANLSAGYTWPLNGGSRIALHGELRHTSQTFFNNFEDDAVRQGSYSLIDARLHWQAPGNHWRFGVWVRNALDKSYSENRIRADGQAGNIDLLAPPRTYGVEISARF